MAPNHLSDVPLERVVTNPEERRALLCDRPLAVKRLDPLPVEAIVRGYIIGSRWKDKQRTGTVCGSTLPEGLLQADKLPEAVYTPSTKAAVEQHDENLDFERTVALVGRELAEQVRDLSLRLDAECAEFALTRVSSSPTPSSNSASTPTAV